MDDAALIGTARWFEAQADGKIRCQLCPHRCVIAPGGRGICRVRQNSDGSLVLPFYGRLSALTVDPIEKKPLYHYYPGSRILSVGFVGCSLRCKFCQNWHISQSTEVETWPTSPAELVRRAREAGSFGIAYTYSEPLIHAEYLLEAGTAAHAAGLKNVLVSNGYLNPEPASEVLGVMDAANIDLKAFDDEFYESETGGSLAEVKRFLTLAASRIHLEVTTLVIPGKNDDPAQIDELAAFVASLGPAIPLHLSCYYPQYKYSIPATPASTVHKLQEVAHRHLPYVYAGNVGGEETNTECPSCGAVLIRRIGYDVKVTGIARGACARCGTAVPIVGLS